MGVVHALSKPESKLIRVVDYEMRKREWFPLVWPHFFVFCVFCESTGGLTISSGNILAVSYVPNAGWCQRNGWLPFLWKSSVPNGASWFEKPTFFRRVWETTLSKIRRSIYYESIPRISLIYHYTSCWLGYMMRWWMMDQFNTFYKPNKENEKRENRWTTPFLEQQTHPSAC